MPPAAEGGLLSTAIHPKLLAALVGQHTPSCRCLNQMTNLSNGVPDDPGARGRARHGAIGVDVSRQIGDVLTDGQH